MLISSIYSNRLKKAMRNRIPRKLKHHEILTLFHIYYSDSLGDFKVKMIDNIYDNAYYFIDQYDNMSSVISEPIRGIYELMPNHEKFETKEIINTKKSYPGYKIKYWFWKNKSHKYDGYNRFLIGKFQINDNKYYTVIGKYDNDTWKDCFIREKR